MTPPTKPKVVHVYRAKDDSLWLWGNEEPACFAGDPTYLGEYVPRARRRREQICEWWEVCSKQCALSTAFDLASAKRVRREMRRDGFIGMLRIVHVIRRKVAK